jgi:uncharacterized protein YbcI
MAETAQQPAGGVASAISTAAVRLLADYTGRGPTKARTVLDRQLVVIVFGDSLTKGETTLASSGQADLVLEIRHRFQNAMQDELSAAVELQTQRKVIAFMSANHIDPDLGVEVFVLDEPVLDVADVVASHEDWRPSERTENGSST